MENPYSAPEAVVDEFGVGCKTGTVKVTAPQVVRAATKTFFLGWNFWRLAGAALLACVALIGYGMFIAAVVNYVDGIFWHMAYFIQFNSPAYLFLQGMWVIFTVMLYWVAGFGGCWAVAGMLRYYTAIFHGEDPGLLASFRRNGARAYRMNMYLLVCYILLLGAMFFAVIAAVGYLHDLFFPYGTAVSDWALVYWIALIYGFATILAGFHLLPGFWLLAEDKEAYRRVMFFGGRVARRNLFPALLCLIWCTMIAVIGYLLAILPLLIWDEIPGLSWILVITLPLAGALFGGYVLMNYVAFCAMTTAGSENENEE